MRNKIVATFALLQSIYISSNSVTIHYVEWSTLNPRDISDINE